MINQKETSLVAKRKIFDSVAAVGRTNNMLVDKSLIQVNRNDHTRYKKAFVEQKKWSENERKKEAEI